MHKKKLRAFLSSCLRVDISLRPLRLSFAPLRLKPLPAPSILTQGRKDFTQRMQNNSVKLCVLQKTFSFSFPFGENAGGKRGCLCAEKLPGYSVIQLFISTLNHIYPAPP